MTRPYHHGRLRQSLLDAGVELARSGGPEAVQLRAVTRAVGVSHNAAYRHFADQEALLTAVSAGCMGRLAELMEHRTAAVRTRRPVQRAWDRFEAIGRSYIEFARAEPGWFRTAFVATAHTGAFKGDAAAGPTPPSGAGPGGLDPFQLLGARLDELVAVGALPGERRAGAEFAAWSAVHGYATLLVDGPLHALAPQEVEAAMVRVLDTIERGI